MKKFILLILLCAAAMHGAAYQPGYKSYNGQDITTDNIYDLTNQASSVQAQVRSQLNQWMALPQKKALLEQLLKFRFENAQGYQAKQGQDNQTLQQNSTPNESAYNYVFGVPFGYHIKIAGPANRIQSALIEHGIWPGMKASPEVVKNILAGDTKTFQTASRAAYFLVLKELLQHNKLDNIKIPETHLVYATDKPELANDDNVFILEKDLPEGARKLTDQDAKKLPDQTISQLVQAIIGAGLWAIKGNIFVDKSGNLYLVDLEQPNNSAPKDFFHKDKARYDGNITSGLGELLDLLAEDQQKLNLVRTLIESNPVIQAPDYSARYKNELMNMLNQKVPVQSQAAQK